MKKIISIMILSVMVFSITGCYSSYDYEEEEAYVSQESKPQAQQPQSQEDEGPEEIILTTENIYDYLMFVTSADVNVERYEYSDSCRIGRGDLSVKVSPKKRGDFNNVVLQVVLDTSSNGWAFDEIPDTRQKEMYITLDGEFEESYYIGSRAVEEAGGIDYYPKFEIVVNSVTGTFVPNK